MADDKKITELDPASNLTDASLFEIVQTGDNLKATMSLLSNYLFGDNARFVAITGPPGGIKLQVKNSSDVWEDVWEYTASS